MIINFTKKEFAIQIFVIDNLNIEMLDSIMLPHIQNLRASIPFPKSADCMSFHSNLILQNVIK